MALSNNDKIRSAQLGFYFFFQQLLSLSVCGRGRDRHRRSTVAPPEQRSLGVLSCTCTVKVVCLCSYVKGPACLPVGGSDGEARRGCQRCLILLLEPPPPPLHHHPSLFLSLPLLHHPSSYQRDGPPHSLRAPSLEVYPRCYSSRTAAWLSGPWEIPLIVAVAAEACGSALHRADSGNILYTTHVIFVYVCVHARAQAPWMYLSKLFFLL